MMGRLKMWAGLRGADLVSVQSAGKSVDEAPDVWKLAAIASFSVLAVVLVGAALIIGVMVHRRKSHKRPLRGKNVYTPALGWMAQRQRARVLQVEGGTCPTEASAWLLALSVAFG